MGNLRQEHIKSLLAGLGLTQGYIERAGFSMEQLERVAYLSQELLTAKQFIVITVDPDRGEQHEVYSDFHNLAPAEAAAIMQDALNHQQRDIDTLNQVKDIIK